MSDLNNTSNHNGEDECEEEGTVTMVDVLKAEEFLEENANAVLGPGDDKNCTYSQGYLKRQALYSCVTCLPVDSGERAGICLACSYHCHADHELVELYTKRNFRCDCGNSLFKGKNCILDPIKSAVNENNAYNDNFTGLYCSCKRPYPDPEDATEDEMLQCVVCEDWFHTRHLGSAVPKEDDYAEMICGPCTDKLPFLHYYLGHAVTKVSKAKDEDSVVDCGTEGDVSLNSSQQEVKTTPSKNSPTKESPTKKVASDIVSPQHNGSLAKESPEKVPVLASKECQDKPKSPNSKEESVTTCKLQESNQTTSTEENVPGNKSEDIKSGSNETKENNTPAAQGSVNGGTSENGKECLLKSLTSLPRGSGATFWPGGFRKLLCTCQLCLETYKEHGVSFLPEETDTVQAYEDEGKTVKASAGGSTQYERGMEALNSLDRVQQMEAILSYNEMKSHLSEYLAKFVANKKVVKEEDIREFFSGMQARKRQKIDIPYTCR